MGAIEYNEDGDVEFSNSEIDFMDPRFFRYCEDNLVGQLLLFKAEAYNLNVVNDNILSYKNKFVVYGYLHHRQESNRYEFVIREITPYKEPFEFTSEELYSKILFFQKDRI